MEYKERLDKACRTFEAASIDYEILSTTGNEVQFHLSKGAMCFNTVIDFDFEHWERTVEMTCSCMDNFIDWKEQEEKRQERRKNRKRKETK